MSMSRLEAVCREQDAKWLHRLSLGIDDEEVCSRLPPAALSLTLSVEPVEPGVQLAHRNNTSRAWRPRLHVHSVCPRLQALKNLQKLWQCSAGQ